MYFSANIFSKQIKENTLGSRKLKCLQYFDGAIIKERDDVDDVMANGRAVFNHSSMQYNEWVWNALV